MIFGSSVRDAVTPALALIVTCGFFAVVAFMMVRGLPESGTTREVSLMLISALATQWGNIVAFYFGSSRGEVERAATVAKALDKATPDVQS